jgi:prophage tail gpP-like protein
MRDDHVELLLGGLLYAGWTEVGITRAMDAAAGTFRLALTDRWVGRDEPWEITPGDACEVRVGGEIVISGYVDIVRSSFSASSHAIEVQGRDRSADLVDCTALHTPDEWRGIDLLGLANRLGKPFGVTARAEVPVGPAFAHVKLDQGEGALEALVRHARMRSLLVMPDGQGNILLTRAGQNRAEVTLAQGENLLEATGTLDWSQRFSDYVVKGQSGYRKEDSDAEREAHIQGQTKDAFVRRYRPLMLTTDADTSGATAQARAVWEANTRIGKSAAASCTVQGWRQRPGGPLWLPNLLVQVRAPWMRMGGQMLVREVTLARGNGGTTAQLEIVSPLTYSPEPVDPKKVKKKKGGKNPWMEVIPEDVRAAPSAGQAVRSKGIV